MTTIMKRLTAIGKRATTIIISPTLHCKRGYPEQKIHFNERNETRFSLNMS